MPTNNQSLIGSGAVLVNDATRSVYTCRHITTTNKPLHKDIDHEKTVDYRHRDGVRDGAWLR